LRDCRRIRSATLGKHVGGAGAAGVGESVCCGICRCCATEPVHSLIAPRMQPATLVHIVCGAAARSHRWLCPLRRPRYAIAEMASALPPGRRPAAAQFCDRKHRLTTLAFWAATLPLDVRLPSQPILSTQYCSKERPGSEGPCGPGLNSKLNEGWWPLPWSLPVSRR
jgi:hypothetical protein